MRRALACDQAVLGQMTADGVDDLRALADQQVAGPEHDGRGLLGLALDGDEPHGRALGRLADRFGICGIVLLPLDERLHVSRRNQPHLVPQLGDLACPVVSARARLHGDKTARLRGEEGEHLIAPQLLAELDRAGDTCRVCLEHVLGQIQSDRANFCHGRLPSSGGQHHHFGTSMPSGGVHSITEIRALLRRLLRAIRANCPKTAILLRADSHYCGPEVLDWCRANGVDFIFGVAPTSTLRRHIERLEVSTMTRYAAAPHAGKVRRCTEVYDAAASGSRVERIIARVEASAAGTDTRFIVTSLPTRSARVLYEDVYCRRGAAENHIKAWKTHLAADRTSCPKATANQVRLFLHAGAYWLMWSLRALMPKRSQWRVAQFDSLRLRLIKIAARVVELKTQIRLHLPTACPDQALLRVVLGRIPRLVT